LFEVLTKGFLEVLGIVIGVFNICAKVSWTFSWGWDVWGFSDIVEIGFGDPIGDHIVLSFRLSTHIVVFSVKILLLKSLVVNSLFLLYVLFQNHNKIIKRVILQKYV